MATVRYKFTFPTDLIQEPIIWKLGREFELVTNIRRANVVASRRLADGNDGAIPRRVGETVDDRKSPYVPLPKDIEKQNLFARQSIAISLRCVLSRSN